MVWSTERRPQTVDDPNRFTAQIYGDRRSAVSGHLDDWEARWAPYDEPTYQTVLSHIGPDDVVLDIGAGDLRLTRRMAQVARRVMAIEMQPGLLAHQDLMPANLTVVCADARFIPWPTDITVGVLLMRHCTQVGLYVSRLRAANCHRLITNARWGLDVEVVELGLQVAWASIDFGWYACACGQTGFVPGPPEQSVDLVRLECVTEVENCPVCTTDLSLTPFQK